MSCSHASALAGTIRFLACFLLTVGLAGCQSQSQSQTQVPAEPPAGDSALSALPEPKPETPTVSRGPRAMPDFVLQDLAGHTVKLSDYTGKAVLINFWATWCPPCKAELPDLVEIQKQFGGDRFTVIGVSLDQTGIEGVRRFVQDWGLNFPILMGNEDVVVSYGNFRGIPTTFLLDSRHELARKYTGLVTRKMVESDLAKVFDNQA